MKKTVWVKLLFSLILVFAIQFSYAQQVFEEVYYEPAPIKYEGLDNAAIQGFAAKAFDAVKNRHNKTGQEYFDSILVLDKHHVLGVYGLALCKFADGEYEGSIEILDPLVNINTKNSGLYSLRARNNMALDNLEKAILDFQKATELGSDENDILSLSQCYFYSGDFNSSLVHADNYLKKQPQKQEGYFVKGLAKSGLKDYEGAITELEKAIELNPKNSIAFTQISWNYVAMKDFNKAVKSINKAIKLDAENADAVQLRAEIKYELHDYTNSIFDCNRVLELDDATENTYLTRGKSNLKLGLKKEACVDFKKALELGNKEVEALIAKSCK